MNEPRSELDSMAHNIRLSPEQPLFLYQFLLVTSQYMAEKNGQLDDNMPPILETNDNVE